MLPPLHLEEYVPFREVLVSTELYRLRFVSLSSIESLAGELKYRRRFVPLACYAV